MHVSTVSKIPPNRNHVGKKGVLHAFAVLQQATVDNAKVRIFRNENIHMIKDGALTKIEGTDKLLGLLRYISEIPKLKKEKETIDRNEVCGALNKNRERKLVGDYDLVGNHGMGGRKHVINSYGEINWEIRNIH